MRQTGISVTPFPENGVEVYLATRRFDRRVKALQTIEAIRDHLALRGQLPASLAELPLPAPLDPLTNQPFAYQVEDKSATLRTPTVAGLTDAQQTAVTFSYRLTLKP